MRWREMPRTRSVAIQYGDDLRAIALRELGNAALWTELAIINDLRPPYIAETSGPGVLAPGEYIRVPSAGRIEPQGDTYLSDLLTRDGRLVVRDGSLALAGGIDNLRQSLQRRLHVGCRELAFHPKYGSYLKQLIGMRGNGMASLAARYAREALMQDFRVRSAKATAAVAGDAVHVQADITPATGPSVAVESIVG